MNEHSFTRAITRLLPSDIHCQSMTAASMTYAGTPDRYIDWHRDLWIEFKYVKRIGRAGVNMGDMVSALQKRWLLRRFLAGGNACVVCGVPSDRTRGFVLETPAEWSSIVPRETVIEKIKPAPELAAYIIKRVE